MATDNGCDGFVVPLSAKFRFNFFVIKPAFDGHAFLPKLDDLLDDLLLFRIKHKLAINETKAVGDLSGERVALVFCSDCLALLFVLSVIPP